MWSFICFSCHCLCETGETLNSKLSVDITGVQITSRPSIVHAPKWFLPYPLLLPPDNLSADLRNAEKLNPRTTPKHVYEWLYIFGVKQVNGWRTFVLAVEAEEDEATQQEQEEKAAGDSSCNAGDGRATQPVTCHQPDKPFHHVIKKFLQHIQSNNFEVPGPILWTSDGSPSLIRALGTTRNLYVNLGSRKKMSTLRSEPPFCLMVRNLLALPRTGGTVWFPLSRSGPFIWISKPLQEQIQFSSV